MVNTDLVSHIETELSKGNSQEEIQVHLKQWNYSQPEINEALKFIEFRKAHNLEQKQTNPRKSSNKNNLAMSILGVLAIAILFSTGTFLFLGVEEPVEMYAPEENITEDTEPELFQLTKLDTTVYLNKDESKKFFVESEEHLITLDRIGENYADIIISSDPIKVTIFVAQDQAVDINGDGVNDISLRLVFTDQKRVSFKIKELEQVAKPVVIKKEICKVDSDCDDDLINTIDSCEWVDGVKKCSNIIRDACEKDLDCDYVENMTGKCVKSSLIPYCEFDEPNECEKDSDCDDKKETTEDSCLILGSRPNRCMYETIDLSDCGKVDEIKYIDGGKDSDYSGSEPLICLGKAISTEIDAEIKYQNDDDEEITLEIYLDDDEYDVQLEFEDLEDDLSFLNDKELDCEYDEDDFLDIACDEENCSKLKSYEIGNDLFTYFLTNLVQTPYELREYCDGNLLDELDPLPTWTLDDDYEDCEYDEDCFDEELETCSVSYFSIYSSDEKIFYQVEDLVGDLCFINFTYLKSDLTEGMSALCKVPKTITEEGDFDDLEKWVETNILTCEGSLKELYLLLENSKDCINNEDCAILYTADQIISINNNSVLDYKIIYKDINFLDKSPDGKDYEGYCKTTGICDKR